MTSDEYVYCQQCGVPVFGPLNEAMRAQVAARPHDFIVYCRQCCRHGALHVEARRAGLL